MWDLPYLEVDDVVSAVLFIASEESGCITGIALPVDLGMSMKYSRVTAVCSAVSFPTAPCRHGPVGEEKRSA